MPCELHTHLCHFVFRQIHHRIRQIRQIRQIHHQICQIHHQIHENRLILFFLLKLFEKCLPAKFAQYHSKNQALLKLIKEISIHHLLKLHSQVVNVISNYYCKLVEITIGEIVTIFRASNSKFKCFCQSYFETVRGLQRHYDRKRCTGTINILCGISNTRKKPLFFITLFRLQW